ncbi:MAG TPA: hypothetical protein VFQ91_21495 [Bryobacteraceae bacterium]|nr:hypothetical protein [Bryobacteraceae bacterium]
MRTRILLWASLACLPLLAKEATVYVQPKDGAGTEVKTSLGAIRVSVDGKVRSIPLSSLLSVHSGEAATPGESARILDGISAIQGTDRKARDLAVESLTLIGVPVMTPLLKAYKDTDQHEPKPLYRLFERIMPSHADTLDRELSLIRLTSGEAIRGKVEPFQLGSLPWDKIRFFAVRQNSITRRVEVHSLRHSTQIEYFDTAILFTNGSRATASASGFSRLSWETDGWATDPNGLQKPGPNYKTNLVDGHPFGALVGRFQAAGEVFFVGKSWTQKAPGEGRLYLAVNDNRHWQNNLGTYRVTVTANNAYDVGDAQ